MRKIRIVAIILFVLAAACLTACGTKDPYASRVSDLVDGVYFGSSETVSLTVTAGRREDPFVLDGAVGDVYPVFTVKIEPVSEFSEAETFSASVVIGGKTYASAARYSPVKKAFVAQFAIPDVTENAIPVTVYRNGESQTVTVQKETDVVSSDAAIGAAAEALAENLKRYVTENGFQGEVQARLTKVRDTAYWFVCFVPYGGSRLSALLAAKTGEVLAVKDGSN